MVRPSTAPAQSLRQAGRRLTASRFGLETDLDYAENDQPVNKNKNKRDIIEDFDEEDEEIDQDDDSSVSVHQGSRLKSSDLKGQLQALRDEHEEMKRDYESLQDKVKSLEDDLKASQMQNKAQKLELNMLNTLLEVNKQAILKPLGSDSKTTIETDPE
jgi:chromosome segregation ATPase